ncbi:cobalamin-binding protein [Actimicrobium sp. CCI2.3]|uniref:cobalamin-binding protein n=1 Tax=Actimicrobium sp. CCI2.3 TaxID=3048616 RepID=UPI002AB444BE|nr:cobalamin-binding protein [Actimicrobium sp. CCI2.3]MDY7573885.1 cobalamin-binding protein [Actimicrobium sp. CCI2.3]MEB0023393.1 cobalamin-binding protein [Actimicrobium sp. CCI2.3]
MRHWRSLIACLFCAIGAVAQAAPVSATDDAGHLITLTTPARRIVSLAPHVTELLFAAGAGERLVGVSDYSDFPAAAKAIGSVGGAAALDIERIVQLKPDLVVAWGSGNSASQLARLRALGMAVFDSEPRTFAAIASSLERLATLAGSEAIGHAAADDFRARLRILTSTYQQRAPVRVFYQIWREPLMTLNGKSMVSTAIGLCGGRNVFAQLPQIAPVVGTEAVLEANPEVILTGGDDEVAALAGWRRFASLLAVRRDNLFIINADWLARSGPRLLDGTELLCRQLDSARRKRPS